MKSVRTIKCRIMDHSKDLENTIREYRKAVTYFIDLINKEWDEVSHCTNKEITPTVERMTHRTKKNPYPVYRDFDVLYYKFPSYFRRAAIAEAFGIVKSYYSNFENYQNKVNTYREEGKTFKDQAPKLQMEHYSYPVFYKGNMMKDRETSTIKLKVFKDNDWKYVTLSFKGKVLNHESLKDSKIKNPSLVKHGKKFALHFPCESEIKLKKKKVEDQVIVAVDLGLTNSAVCSAMEAKGTVIGRCFIDQPVEKDRMQTRLNKLKKTKRLSGTKNRHPNAWRKIKGYHKQIVQDTVNQIVDFAREQEADVIVFEYLGEIKGRNGNKERLHHWAKRDIQSRTMNKAHRYGIRVNRVSPKNTSKLAYDGSGEVKRNDKKDLCTFTTGKVYHADLNASYNIGARYFIREILKPLSEKRRLLIEAEVPVLTKRASCTLDSLVSLSKAV